MFLELIDEMKDITVVVSLIRILGLAFYKLREASSEADDFIEEMINIFVGLVMEKYGMKICFT